MNEPDFSLYRPCVGVALFRADGLVFIAHRADVDANDSTQFGWQMPQGGIDPGETPEAAARRELYEETHVSSASLLAEAPDWLIYDFPDGIGLGKKKQRYRGQAQRWFAFLLTGAESEIDIAGAEGHAPEFSAWRWERLEVLPSLIVPFKRPVYQGVVKAFAPIALRLNSGG